MKKYIIMSLMLMSLGIMKTHAQVGIPTNNPNKNSVLDLNKTDGTNDKGLLLPKVALTATNSSLPLSAHVAGMYVYNTATASTGGDAVSPGEYYNDGTKWLRMPTSPWFITGNTGTDPATHFLGTTDAVDLAVKVNNTEKMRVTKTGNILVGTNTVPVGGTNAKLIIDNGTTAGALQIVDGGEAAGKVLMADANGLATWQDPIKQKPINMPLGGVGVNVLSTGTAWYYSGTTLKLPPGKWLISMDCLMIKNGGPTAANETWWIRSSFSDSSSVLNLSPDIVSQSFYISGLLPSSSACAMMKGSIVLNNTSNTTKTYYYMVGNSKGPNRTGSVLTGGTSNTENRLIIERIY